uniref:Uncharacterized protein n=1 Tax=Pyxicephalus adspersus TaxID=30357 RepID=A0A499QU73_PYXAD|nr:hypothetical protein maker-92A13-exonerate_protein2genome-gene-0.6 [Pyxicephalus adspersus]
MHREPCVAHRGGNFPQGDVIMPEPTHSPITDLSPLPLNLCSIWELWSAASQQGPSPDPPRGRTVQSFRLPFGES